jgi:hypothetical protein
MRLFCISDQYVRRGDFYNYTLDAYDEDSSSDELMYTLVSGPAGLTLSGNNLFWFPKDIGSFNVSVKVSDGEKDSIAEFRLFVFDSISTSKVRLIVPDTLEGYYNQAFSFDVDALDPDGDQLIYSDDSDLFDINPGTGEISFTPQVRGEYNVNISVRDEQENEDSKIVKFIIN